MVQNRNVEAEAESGSRSG